MLRNGKEYVVRNSERHFNFLCSRTEAYKCLSISFTIDAPPRMIIMSLSWIGTLRDEIFDKKLVFLL